MEALAFHRPSSRHITDGSVGTRVSDHLVRGAPPKSGPPLSSGGSRSTGFTQGNAGLARSSACAEKTMWSPRMRPKGPATQRRRLNTTAAKQTRYATNATVSQLEFPQAEAASSDIAFLFPAAKHGSSICSFCRCHRERYSSRSTVTTNVRNNLLFSCDCSALTAAVAHETALYREDIRAAT